MTQPILQHFGQVIHHHDDSQPDPRFSGPGRCLQVDAGAGDPNRLSPQAVKAIQDATMLLVDDLVNEAVVALATTTARVIYVGKRGGGPSTTQAFVDKLILMAVREGEQVVHLKAGKPFAVNRTPEDKSPLQAGGLRLGGVVSRGGVQ